MALIVDGNTRGRPNRWLIDYYDSRGRRRVLTLLTKAEADAVLPRIVAQERGRKVAGLPLYRKPLAPRSKAVADLATEVEASAAAPPAPEPAPAPVSSPAPASPTPEPAPPPKKPSHATRTPRQLPVGLALLKELSARYSRKLLNRNTSLGRSMAQYREDLIRDLGGESGLSAMQRTTVDVAVRTALLLHVCDIWIETLVVTGGLINKQTLTLAPIVADRRVLARDLVSCMSLLGLERHAPPMKSIEAAFAELEPDVIEPSRLGAGDPTDADPSAA